MAHWNTGVIIPLCGRSFCCILWETLHCLGLLLPCLGSGSASSCCESLLPWREDLPPPLPHPLVRSADSMHNPLMKGLRCVSCCASHSGFKRTNRIHLFSQQCKQRNKPPNYAPCAQMGGIKYDAYVWCRLTDHTRAEHPFLSETSFPVASEIFSKKQKQACHMSEAD